MPVSRQRQAERQRKPGQGLAEKVKQSLCKSRQWTKRPEVLLCPNIPKPMHGLSPRSVLGQSWWDKTRKEAYASTFYHCIACGVSKHQAKGPKWLEGHEWYDIDYNRGRMTYVETLPLCNFCHAYIHDGRLLSLLQKKEITPAKYASVIQHGDRVLAEAGLQKMTHQERDDVFKLEIMAGRVAEWSDWRLVIDDVEIPPLYSSIEEWKEAYA